MPRSVAYSAYRLYRFMRTLEIADFSGGWNTKAAPTLLGVNESPDMLNVTLDEQGSFSKRLGCQAYGTAVPASGTPTVIFWWESGGQMLAQIGATVWASPDMNTWTAVGTFSTPDRCGFTDFAPSTTPTLVIGHPIDGVYLWQGTGTWTLATYTDNGPLPKGNRIATWQNKVWLAGDPSFPSRLYASNAGAPGQWSPNTDYNDMREKDSAPITALVSGQGRDQNAAPGLMVFKESWWGRVSDPKAGTTFGQYTTLHNEAGAAGPEAVTTATTGQVVSVHAHGIHMSDGVNPPTYVSQKIENVFAPGYLNLAKAPIWNCTFWRDRILISLTRSGSSYPDFTLEFHPGLGWIVPHSFGFTSLTHSHLGNESRVFGGSTSDGRIFEVFKGWTDDGQTIPAHYQTRWYAVAGGYTVRLRRTRMVARGDFNVFIKGDQTEDQGASYHFTGDLPTIWGNPEHPFSDFFSPGVAKTWAWRVEENSQTAAYGRTLLPSGQPEEIGSFAVYGFSSDYMRLGYA